MKKKKTRVRLKAVAGESKSIGGCVARVTRYTPSKDGLIERVADIPGRAGYGCGSNCAYSDRCTKEVEEVSRRTIAAYVFSATTCNWFTGWFADVILSPDPQDGPEFTGWRANPCNVHRGRKGKKWSSEYVEALREAV